MINDPREDLKQDSKLWLLVLSVAKATNHIIYDLLHGFRCAGAKLEYNSKGLILKPRGGNSKLYRWNSEKEWKKDRKKFLMPKKKKIKEIFDQCEKIIEKEDLAV